MLTDRFDIYDSAINKWSIGVLPISIYDASVIFVNNTNYVARGLLVFWTRGKPVPAYCPFSQTLRAAIKRNKEVKPVKFDVKVNPLPVDGINFSERSWPGSSVLKPIIVYKKVFPFHRSRL
jgi:hypothetical protein